MPKAAHNIATLRKRARHALPRPIFDYIDGGAEDEVSLRQSTHGFDTYDLLPRMLADVSTLRTQTQLFGHTISWPLMLAPTGLTRLFHRDAEAGVAAGVQGMNIPYCLSTLGTTTIEEFAEQVDGPKLFQIYIFKDRGLTQEFVDRARDAGADHIMVSNHGGRQVDGCASPIDQIAPIADAVGGEVKIICDGGVRRGSHIMKALALGADACAVGRPYLYGLAASGPQGVRNAVNILHDEFTRSLILVGCPDVAQLDGRFLRHQGQDPHPA